MVLYVDLVSIIKFQNDRIAQQNEYQNEVEPKLKTIVWFVHPPFIP